MKVSIKTLKGMNSQIDVEPTDKISDVKQKIHAAFGAEFDPQGLKLIHAGRVLVDDKSVSDYNIKENEFLVVMPNKSSAASSAPASGAAAAAAAAAAPAATPAAAATPAPAAPVSALPAATPHTPAVSATPAQPPAHRGIEVSQADIQAVADMGFSHEQAERALRAAFGNRDRAVEYLFSGIPASALADASGAAASPAAVPATPAVTSSAPASASAPATSGASAPASAPAPAAAAAATGRPAHGAASIGTLPADSPLASLAANANFLQLRAVVQQRPQLLPAILQQLAEQQPDIVQLINQNQEDFYILLNSGPTAGGALPPGTVRIQLSEADAQAIERLCALGFERNRVIEAYLACDRDENLAANFLFNQME